MSGLVRVLVLSVVTSLAFWACTGMDKPDQIEKDGRIASSEDRSEFVGDTSIELPPTWSYMVSRQAAESQEGGSWLFTLSPLSFHLGRRCDRETGPLVGSLFERAEVFITGGAYLAEFPASASVHKQTPGKFQLDDVGLAQHEGFCVRTHRIDFELDGYYVSMHVAVHRKATDAIVTQALEALNSIH